MMTVRLSAHAKFLILASILGIATSSCGERFPRRSRITRPCDSARAGKTADSLCREDLDAASSAMPAAHWPECDERVRRLPIKGADSLSMQARCVIVTGAIRALAAQPDSLAPPFASDTAVIAGATIGHFQFRAVTGQLVPGYWTVDLKLRSRSYGVAIQLSDEGRTISIGPST